MKFLAFSVLVLLVTGYLVNCASDDDHHDHGDDNHDDHHHHSDYEPREFDHDPHHDDSDYDEDVLSGTSHHDKKSKEALKTELDTLFKKVDTNTDKKIDKDELVSHLIESMKKLHNESSDEEFKRVDINKDNKVTLDEYFLYEHGDPVSVMDNITAQENTSENHELKKRLEHEKERFKAADNDGDDSLNAQEYLLFKYPVFYPHMAHTVVHDYIQDLDVNKDGGVDLKEYVEHFHIADNKNKTEAAEDLKKVNADFAKYDKNQDGKIDSEEYYAILKPGYEEPARSEAEYLIKDTDKNKDGVVTLDEMTRHSRKWVGGEPLGSDAAFSGEEHGHRDDEDDDDEDDGADHDEL